MSPRRGFLTTLPVMLLLAACGGSSHHVATSSTTTTTSAASASAPAAASTATSSTKSGTTATSSVPPEVAGSGTSAPPATGTARGSGAAGGATNVRVPASYVIRLGGKLDPPVVTVPAFLAIQLSVTSGDGTAHSLVVKTPSPHTLAVPAHGGSSVLIGGLRAGRYTIDVDGRPGGSLTIGGEPGP